MLLTIIVTIKYSCVISKRRQVAVGQSVGILVISCVVQKLCPNILLSSFAMVLIMYCIYMALENPAEYIEKDTNVINGYGFNAVVREKLSEKKNFVLVSIVIDDWTLLYSKFGRKFCNSVIKELKEYVQEMYRLDIFTPASGCPTLIIDNTANFNSKSNFREAQRIADRLRERLNDIWEIDKMNISLKWHLFILECPEYAETMDDVLSKINFFVSHKSDSDHHEVDNVIIYDENLKKIMNRQSTIVDILQKAIKDDGIEMYYQPIYSTVKHSFYCAEALVRLKDKETLGFISPEEFIPIAEKEGLIVDLSLMIFDKVCNFIKSEELMKKGIRYIEVNLSAAHCMDNRLVGQLTDVMKKYNIPPEALNLEITETTALNADKLVLKNINTLVGMGCGLSMDDYGTGFSNLIQLSEIPFDIAKLDKSIVWGYFDDKDKIKVVLKSTVDMFNELHMGIVAEGVETKKQAEVLGEMGVEYLQGYYYSRPIPADEFVEFIETQN